MNECKGCENRYPGCQSKCPVGIKAAEENEKRRAERNKAKRLNGEYADFMYGVPNEKRWNKKKKQGQR